MNNFKIIFVVLLTLTASCTNIKSKKLLSTSANPSLLATVLAASHKVANLSITDPSAVTTPATKLLALSVDLSFGTFKSLQQFCATDGTNPCQCEITWNETNSTSSTAQVITRTKRLPVIEVQSGAVKCSMLSSFWAEIPPNTTLHLNIIPTVTGGNLTALNVTALDYRTGTSTNTNGDFRDSTLNAFINIKHYTCHTKNIAPHEILNKTVSMNTPDTGSGSTSVDAMLGNKFCSSLNGGSDCATPRNGFSAQNYYRNLYVRSNKVPINSSNTWYDCPLVEEALQYSSASTTPVGDKGKFWPLDSQFALSLSPSSEWSVPVAASAALYKAGDPDTGTSDGACVNEPDPSGPNSRRIKEGGIVSKCLGYAKLPKGDGTCGTITDSNGRVRPLVRLRKFRTIYPSFFDASEKFKPKAFNPEADEVYVADRLVVNNLGVSTGNMIYGPKPCNFAWFDHEGVTNRSGTVDFYSRLPGDTIGGTHPLPGYVGTNKYYTSVYSGLSSDLAKMSVNPDGLFLPNVDKASNLTSGRFVQQSCSATLPLTEYALGSPSYVRLVTSNIGRTTEAVTIEDKTYPLAEIHVRPVDPWSPDYLEDKTFQACVPMADPYLDPPLHFYAYNATGNAADQYMGWCAKVYPTQNPYWMEVSKTRASTTSTSLATLYPGWPARSKVDHFTSIKSSDVIISNNKPACVANQDICLNTGASPIGDCKTYLGEAVAANRCDRTVRFQAGKIYKDFPLQANRTDIVDMLKNDRRHDKHYSCTYSVNVDSSKVDTLVPGSGCCGMYNNAKVLKSLMPPDAAVLTDKDAHLEPYYNNAFPSARYCGSPQE